MALVQLIAWAASLAVLGAMFFLATIAFRSGEFAGRQEIVRPAHPGGDEESDETTSQMA